MALAKAQKPADQTGMLYKDCVGKGNYTTNSTYHANLNQLLTSIYTNTEINNGFYNFSYGEDADTVYSIVLCRPDIRPDDCRSCIRNASDSLVRNCPNFVEAIGGLDNCMVRYANRSIFDRMEQGPYFWVYDDRSNVSDVVGFNQSRMTLLGMLSDQAAEGDSRYKYARGQRAVDFQIIYALVQCTPDLSASACRDCLYNASGLIPQCCNARPGGRVIYPSCNFRYEISRFWIADSTNSIPPPTLTNSIPSPPASTSQDLYEMEDVELLQLDFGTISAATGDFSEFNKLGQGGFGVVYKSWRKWNGGITPLDIIDPTLNVGPRSEIMRSIHIGLLCVQENEALRPTMAQVSMMLSNYSVSLAAPSKPAFLMLRETSILPLLSVSDESRTKSPQWSNNELSISELDPR
ncbi:CYSTEINE-RICH RECEPTOR-KINASE-LIKE PROTEIN [Salix purpurea]|uniref:CYSTEINE-RICH RECEPTOR-KINASE-LIKE PROTEIN n=1 Tax=Salix purpurea TaxID=77065 RepID=A0A9Q0WPF4_SALPP|nr:CYSTEINE-RICH RECEPTOR-KINASE-LIKE PROTEIN [Salix purpurea]